MDKNTSNAKGIRIFVIFLLSTALIYGAYYAGDYFFYPEPEDMTQQESGFVLDLQQLIKWKCEAGTAFVSVNDTTERGRELNDLLSKIANQGEALKNKRVKKVYTEMNTQLKTFLEYEKGLEDSKSKEFKNMQFSLKNKISQLALSIYDNRK